jgi:hypothetical protein
VDAADSTSIQRGAGDINARAEMTYRARVYWHNSFDRFRVERTSYGLPAVCLLKPCCQGFHNFLPILQQLGSQFARTNIAINPVYERSKAFSGMDNLPD